MNEMCRNCIHSDQSVRDIRLPWTRTTYISWFACMRCIVCPVTGIICYPKCIPWKLLINLQYQFDQLQMIFHPSKYLWAHSLACIIRDHWLDVADDEAMRYQVTCMKDTASCNISRLTTTFSQEHRFRPIGYTALHPDSFGISIKNIYINNIHRYWANNLKKVQYTCNNDLSYKHPLLTF